MKYTAIIVMIIGVIILLFSGFMGMQSTPVSANASEVTSARTSTILPILFGVTALLAGALMLAFGGRGYFRSKSLAVRN